LFSFLLQRCFQIFFLLCVGYAPLLQADEHAVFDAAYAAFQNRDDDALALSAQSLAASKFILAPYAEYWGLLLNLETTDSSTIQAFLARYPDTPFAEKLRSEWLKTLGKQEKWDVLLAEYSKLDKEDTAISCYVALARYSQQEAGILDAAKPLWFNASDQPSNCNDLFAVMRQQKVLSADDVWARLRLALQANQIAVAKSVARQLSPAPDAAKLKLFDRVADNPQKMLEINSISVKTRLERELNLYALERVARRNPRLALELWEKIASSYQSEDQNYLQGRLALQAARNHLHEALDWYKKAGDTLLDKEQQVWKARAALRSGNWEALLATIAAMPQAIQNEPAWRYWQARALKEKGQLSNANAILVPLSKERHYYGQLAEDELGEFVSTPVSVYKANDTDIAAIENLPGIQRSLALYSHNLQAESRKEWQWAIRNLDDTRLIAAAELAMRQEWIDLAINTADKTQFKHDFALRYPMPFRDKLQNNTRDNQLDEAWVYGLIRQESRFISYARSSVGASGLMQIMPATAKWIAKRIGMSEYHHGMVNHIDTNIQFGTHYLRHVLDVSNSQAVVATAAYNAGPGRAKRWVGKTAIEGAVYIETIPFGETRDYVKKVMSNAQFYAQRLGLTKQALKQRLGTVMGTNVDSQTPMPDEDI
jgi:soluble lytic murein transglycosylase